MKKLFSLFIILLAVVYISSCDGKEDDTGIDLIIPVDSTDTAVAQPE